MMARCLLMLTLMCLAAGEPVAGSDADDPSPPTLETVEIRASPIDQLKAPEPLSPLPPAMIETFLNADSVSAFLTEPMNYWSYKDGGERQAWPRAFDYAIRERGAKLTLGQIQLLGELLVG